MITINEQIIRGCINKDKRSQAQLFDNLKPRLQAIIYNLVRSDLDSESITSLAMSRIFHCIHQFKFEGSFEGWCLRIAKHAISDFYRKKTNEVISIEGFVEKHPIYGMDYLETRMQINPSVNNGLGELVMSDYFNLIKQLLTPREYSIFMLYYEGYSHKEIGEMLSISEGTSKWHTHQARIKLINNTHFKKLKT